LRPRWPSLLARGGPAAVLAIVAIFLADGCGGVGVSTAGTVSGDHLTIYSSLPLEGAMAPVSRQIVGGEKLALAQAGGRVHRFKIYYASLNDANPKTGEWAPGETATNAKYAAQDTTTIAYLGDYDSEATAISLPIVNEAGILQVSPASPYVGLTSSLDANQDEPERFYQTGKRNFARLMPGDPVQAAAQVQLMRSLGVGRVYVLEDQDPFDLPLAAILAEDAKRAGIEVAGEDTIDTTASTEFAGEAKKVSESGAQAVFFSGLPDAGAVALWQQLHAADPHLRLLGSSSLSEGSLPSASTSGSNPTSDASATSSSSTTSSGAGDTSSSSPSVSAVATSSAGAATVRATESSVPAQPSFAVRIGTAGDVTYLATPVLPAALYPSVAQVVLRRYRGQFHEAASSYALYGYEAMSAVLLAIRRAGSHGNARQAVIDKFFAIRDRDSVLGRYSIQAGGDTTLSRYGVDRVVGGRLVFYRAFETS
jgi:branched-chain amino acid transport system substrate-binding protein